MIVSILQPSYLPWIGMFDLMHKSDVFVYHCDVQYDKSWRNRNRIRTKEGTSWLSVPVMIKGNSRSLVKDMEIDNSQKWARRHWNLILANYRKAPFFDTYGNFFDVLYNAKKWKYLADLNYYIVDNLLDFLGMKVKIEYSSSLDLGDSRGNDRIIRICRALGADTWLANSACRDYVDAGLYDKSGIKMIYHDYNHPEYKQLYEPFISHLSVIDLLFCCGKDSLPVITAENIEKDKLCLER